MQKQRNRKIRRDREAGECAYIHDTDRRRATAQIKARRASVKMRRFRAADYERTDYTDRRKGRMYTKHRLLLRQDLDGCSANTGRSLRKTVARYQEWLRASNNNNLRRHTSSSLPSMPLIDPHPASVRSPTSPPATV